eukprot:SAG31_NODE_49_length_30599_cov_15.615016_3_plen_276_part_00
MTRALAFERIVELTVSSAALSNWEYDEFLEETTEIAVKDNQDNEESTLHAGRSARPLSAMKIYVPEEQVANVTPSFERGLVWAEATAYARAIGNRRADRAGPSAVEAAARAIVLEAAAVAGGGAPEGNCSIRVLGPNDLAAEGLVMLAAVGQAAANDATKAPRLVVLEWHGKGVSNKGGIDTLDNSEIGDSKQPVLGLVGKGVTFDTGSLNLKPTGFIEQMHLDMGGAAAVLAAFRSVALHTRPPGCSVVAVLALAENAVGPPFCAFLLELHHIA